MIGFVILTSMKVGMERKLDYITANMEDEDSSINAKSIIWWIVCTTAWGIVSMFIVVLCFHNYFG